MIAYILKSSLSLIILFGLYWFLLRKEKLFVFNRYFLVLSVIFSLTVPFISIPVNFQVTPLLENAVPVSVNNIPGISDVNITRQYLEMQASQIDISEILLALYITGVIIFLIRLLRNIYILAGRINRSEKISFEGYRIVLTDDTAGPCCFFRNILINRDDYLNGRIDKALLEHEKEHARQTHTIDIMLIELLKIFYWFNPVYLLYDRAIRINHEYLADNGVISDKSDIKSYADILLSFIICRSSLSLTSGSNNSFTKMRLIMMMRSKPKGFIKRMKIAMSTCAGLVLFLLLSFKESPDLPSKPVLSETGIEMQQSRVNGIVITEDGKPLMLVNIIAEFPGSTPGYFSVTTGSDGRFSLKNIPEDAFLNISCVGYKRQTLKPGFTSEMVVKMIKDPEFKTTVMTVDATYYHEGENVRIRRPDDKNLQSVIVIDDKISNSKGEITLVRDDIGMVKVLKGKEATDKYGEKGKNGVIEIMTKKRAAELGIDISPPVSRLRQKDPDDLPTFQESNPQAFQEWVSTRIRYPEEAISRNIEGWVSVNYKVNPDGSISNITTALPVNSLLSDEVIRVIKSSPKWESSKNMETGRPIESSVTLKFTLPGGIIKDQPYDRVDEMPVYPGGENALLNFIKNNTKYPQKLTTEKIEGKVILRFIVTTEGNSEAISVLKGIHPLLDAEAIRVISLMKGWEPAKRDGKTVNAWYMIPVAFALPQTN
ncbi:MAG: TonB family protein [Bacteroidales bacterium]|nr:TonB family protein [Bacteroidales bacterium]